jgi:hypothetical protein
MPRFLTIQEHEVRETETAAHQLSVKLQPVQVRDPIEFQNAYAEIGALCNFMDWS